MASLHWSYGSEIQAIRIFYRPWIITYGLWVIVYPKTFLTVHLEWSSAKCIKTFLYIFPIAQAGKGIQYLQVAHFYLYNGYFEMLEGSEEMKLEAEELRRVEQIRKILRLCVLKPEFDHLVKEVLLPLKALLLAKLDHEDKRRNISDHILCFNGLENLQSMDNRL